MRPKNTNGTFQGGFPPSSSAGTVEGTGAQYTPMVPFDIGAPYRTQQTVREMRQQIYADRPAGNGELGAMGSSLVWSARGMYPEAPGTTTMALGSPLSTAARRWAPHRAAR